MSQSLWFRQACEIHYKMCDAEKSEQASLRKDFTAKLQLAADTMKKSFEEMRAILLMRHDRYVLARMSGKSENEAFEIAANRALSLS